MSDYTPEGYEAPTTEEPNKGPLVTRKPTDLARKLVAYLAGGVTATGVIGLAAVFGVELDPTLAGAVVVIVGSIAGYFTKERLPKA